MSSLSEDLQLCVQRTEDMLMGWTEFALKYSKENVNLDVQIHRERLLTALKIFAEVSREIDKIVFCSEENGSNLAAESSRSQTTTAISAQPIEFTRNKTKTRMESPQPSVDSSSQSSAEISQPNPPVELFAPNMGTGDRRRNNRHLSPARFRSEARLESRKNIVTSSEAVRTSSTDLTVSDEEDHLIVDLTDDSTLFLEMNQVYLVDDELTNQSTSTNAKNSERANSNHHSSASVSTANIMDQNSDIMPLAEQLYLSDEDSNSQFEDAARSKSNNEKASEIPDNSRSLKMRIKKVSPASSQPEYVLSPATTTNTQSFLEVSPGSSRVSLSASHKSPISQKSQSKKNVFVRFSDEQWTQNRSKNSQRKEPPAFACGLCKKIFPTSKSRSEHMATMHPDIFRTFCRGCGQRLRRFEAVSHYSRCLVYQHENHVDRVNGMRRVLEKPNGVLFSCYNMNHLQRQRKLLEESNDIDIPAVPPRWRVPRKIDSYFEVLNWPRNKDPRNSYSAAPKCTH